MDALASGIGWTSLVLGAASIAVGLVVAWNNRKLRVPEPTKPEVGDHGAVKDAIDSVTEFAKALKDLDLSGKLLTVGLLLIAIASVVAGLDNIAEAIKAAK